jgi:hypothetical protein
MGRPEKMDPTLRRKLGLLRSEVHCSIHQDPTPIAGCSVQVVLFRLFRSVVRSVGKGATCAWPTAHAEADGLLESILPFGVEFTSARPLGVMWASRTVARASAIAGALTANIGS